MSSQNDENNYLNIEEISMCMKKELNIVVEINDENFQRNIVVSQDTNIESNFSVARNNDDEILNNTFLNENESGSESLAIDYSPGDLGEAYIKSETGQESDGEVEVAENSLERGPVLIVNCNRSSECDAKYYQKMLGTCEKLFVNFTRENLHELQRQYIENPRNTAKKGKSRMFGYKRNMFQCKMCPFTSKDRCDVLIHIVDSHKEFAAENKLPPAKCITRGDRPGDVYYKCVDCPHGTKWRGDFYKHLFRHKSLQDVEETFTCATCSYVCKMRTALVQHMRRHSRIVYKCSHCDYQANVRMYLKRHVRDVHRAEELEILKCANCSFQTRHKDSMRKHVLIHSNSRKLYKCPLCPFQSHLLTTIKGNHQLLHKSEEETRIYRCGVCPFKAKTNGDLKKHTLVHKGPDEVPMFKCSVCSFQTKYRSYLKRHSLNHQVPEDDKGHQCNLCDYKGKWAVNLRVHFRNVHRNPSEGKMHKCTQCPYQSRYSLVFKRHLLQHIPVEKRTSYPCDNCDFRAITKEGLKAHWKNMHQSLEERKKFVCAKCGFQTTQKLNLIGHMSRKHVKPSKKKKSVTTSTRSLQIRKEKVNI